MGKSFLHFSFTMRLSLLYMNTSSTDCYFISISPFRLETRNSNDTQFVMNFSSCSCFSFIFMSHCWGARLKAIPAALIGNFMLIYGFIALCVCRSMDLFTRLFTFFLRIVMGNCFVCIHKIEPFSPWLEIDVVMASFSHQAELTWKRCVNCMIPV